MLEVHQLNYKIKSRKTDFAIRDISFSLEQGYFMCLLGRNGAGKSTLLRLLYGLQQPDQGEVRYRFDGMTECRIEKIKGKPKEAALAALLDIRQRTGYLGEENIFFEAGSIRENVSVLGKLYPDFQEEEYLDCLRRFDIPESILAKNLTELSKGQEMLVQLAFLFARHPRLFLLDEPMANLDPVVRMEFMELIQERIAEEEASVILSTHLLDDIDETVDYIGVLDGGRMKLFGNRESVLEEGENLRKLVEEAEI